MSNEARNVETLKQAYKRWSDTLGGSVDEWLKICDENIAFGSLAQGAPEGAKYLTEYRSRDSLKEYFAGLERDWQMLEFATEHFIAQGDRVVMSGAAPGATRKPERWSGPTRPTPGASPTARRSNISSITIPLRCTPRWRERMELQR